MRVQPQRGGFVMGLIVGLLVGLAVALAVALWVTKVPVPFINKVPQRPSDSADAERNRSWDPNSQIGGKGAAARPGAGSASAPASTPPGTALPPYVPPVPPPVGAVPGAATAGATPRAGAVAPAPRGQASGPSATAPAAAPVTTPIAAPSAAAKPGTAGSDPFSYFVQAGAYTKPEDAEQQRARLAILGYAAKVTEREQVGKTMYRVRLGPFDRKDGAEAAQAKLQEAGVDAALVRVERSPTATAGR